MTLGTIFLSEFIGTAVLLLLGVGVVANALLKHSKGQGGGLIVILFGWGFAVFTAVYIAYKSGAHLNPAVTLGIAVSGKVDFVPGIAVNFASIATYLSAQIAGAFTGAVIAWLAFKQHYDAHEDKAEILATFATGPAIRSPFWNAVTECIGTFVLVAWVLVSGNTTSGLGPLGVAIVVVSIGASLGGPTGYAINPARDLGPRIAHTILPIKGKGKSDWGYALVPIIAPVIGGVLAGLVFGTGALNIFH